MWIYYSHFAHLLPKGQLIHFTNTNFQCKESHSSKNKEGN